MNRLCEICGAEIEIGEGVCSQCGTKHLAIGEQEEIYYDVPRWGGIDFKFCPRNLEVREHQKIIFLMVWRELERITALSFFPGQVENLDLNDDVSLYGTYRCFLVLKDEVFNLGGEIYFHELPLGEVEKIFRT